MRIAILDLTAQPSPLLDGMPRVAEQIEAWLGPALSEANFLHCDLAHGAPLPHAADFDGVIVSGSEFGVYDRTDWMQPLREFLVAVKADGKPIYGICFGHQIMADVFGGKAEKVGMVIGAKRFQDDTHSFDANVWHQDQVTKTPPNAKVTASAAHCPIGALDYEFPAMSVQYHPEYRHPHLRELFRRGRDIFVDAQLADMAEEGFDKSDVSIALGATEAANFFRGHLG